MDETHIKVSGQWKHLYRAVVRDGDTVDFLLTAKRDKAAVRRFLERAITLHESHTTDAGLQVILECSDCHRRYRNHAHDQEGADGMSRRTNHVRSQPVLQPRRLISSPVEQLLLAIPHYCNRTENTVILRSC
jgi:transposase-like protein